MQSHHALWIVVFGKATAVTGCVSMKSLGETTMVDQSDHYRLTSPPSIIATVDGFTLVEPSEFSPTESVENTIPAELPADTIVFPQTVGRESQVILSERRFMASEAN